ncbi:MAG: ABC-type Na+ efflux pump permease subunit [Verrucomicrobiales bacterium]|jgi:ABC-type Na+ efflux pump permease subunit
MSDHDEHSEKSRKLTDHVLPAFAFSPSRVWVLTQSTFTQLVRMRTFYFLIVFVLIILAVAMLGFLYGPVEHLKAIKRWSFGAIYVFSMIFAISATSLMLPRDLEDRTLYTILSKPVPRFEYLLGKLFGVILVIGTSMLVMFALMCLLVMARMGPVEAVYIQDLQRASGGEPLTPNDFKSVEVQVKAAGVSLNLFWGLWGYFLKASIIAAMTLLISTFATGTLFTIIMSTMIVFIGHFIQLAVGFWEKEGGTLAGIVSAPFEIIFADLKMFDVVDQVITGTSLPFSQALELTGLGLFYIAIYTLIAQVIFVDKEL